MAEPQSLGVALLSTHWLPDRILGALLTPPSLSPPPLKPIPILSTLSAPLFPSSLTPLQISTPTTPSKLTASQVNVSPGEQQTVIFQKPHSESTLPPA